jgi:hypothetical protein
VETVKHWIRSGELVAVNVSRNRQSGVPRLRVRQSDLDAFLAVRSTSTSKPKADRRRPRSLPPVKSFY